jgi:hypothetical protein
MGQIVLWYIFVGRIWRNIIVYYYSLHWEYLYSLRGIKDDKLQAGLFLRQFQPLGNTEGFQK